MFINFGSDPVLQYLTTFFLNRPDPVLHCQPDPVLQCLTTFSSTGLTQFCNVSLIQFCNAWQLFFLTGLTQFCNVYTTSAWPSFAMLDNFFLNRPDPILQCLPDPVLQCIYNISQSQLCNTCQFFCSTGLTQFYNAPTSPSFAVINVPQACTSLATIENIGWHQLVLPLQANVHVRWPTFARVFDWTMWSCSIGLHHIRSHCIRSHCTRLGHSPA